LRFGPFKLDVGKSYSDLVQMINREKGSSIENLKGSPQTQLSEYKSWTFTCVSLISERMSTIPYKFYRSDTGEEVTSKSKAYKIFTKPFFKPNEMMTFRFLKSFCQIQLDLCGMTCIYKARNKLGQIWELWPLNMNDFVGMEVTNNFLDPVVKYVFNFDNKQVTFDSSELIVINYPNPKDPYAPMSPIQAQAYAADIDSYIEVYERDFFKNSARIDMALYTTDNIDQEKADEIKDRWKSKYSGTYHDVAVLSSGLKPVPLNFTNKDFEFLHLAGWSKSKIFGCFKVPVSKAGGDTDSNRAGSVTADIAFNRECIQPRLTLFDEELTHGVLHEFDDRLLIKHENPIPRDRDLEVKEARVYLNGQPSMTTNEWRKDRGLPPVKNGDRLYISTNVVPLDDIDKYLSNNNDPDSGGSSGGDNETDPTRHDDDKPNVNEDGTDDRDEAPTDGRSIEDIDLVSKLGDFSEYEASFRKTWNELLLKVLKKTNKRDMKTDVAKALAKITNKTIGVLFKHMGVKPIEYDVTNWVSPISEKLAFEYRATIFKYDLSEDKSWDVLIEEQFDTNPRMAKITNTLLRATINYAKWLVMTDQKISIEWTVNGNECGHKGRLQNIKTKQAFPNQIPNFSCDCTIQPKKEN
jgi:HK97 family phage portal protein